MGKSTISMAIFHSYVKLPEGTGLEWDLHYILLPEKKGRPIIDNR